MNRGPAKPQTPFNTARISLRPAPPGAGIALATRVLHAKRSLQAMYLGRILTTPPAEHVTETPTIPVVYSLTGESRVPFLSKALRKVHVFETVFCWFCDVGLCAEFCSTRKAGCLTNSSSFDLANPECLMLCPRIRIKPPLLLSCTKKIQLDDSVTACSSSHWNEQEGFHSPP